MKRSPLKRSAPLNSSKAPEAKVKSFKPKACSARKGGCGQTFVPSRAMQCACSIPCSIAMVGRANEKKAARVAIDDRRATRAALDAIKTRPQLEKEVEQEMNRYVRLRDFAQGCISCGRPFNPGAIGGSCDAGHYRSKGSAKHLRFDIRNLHGQCKHCNDFLGGNPTGYRTGLISKIGIQAVEALECDQAPRKHSKDELRAMRAHYRSAAKSLEKASP